MIKDYPGSLYGRYRNPKFTDVYDNAEDFLADYKDVGIPTSISDESATTLYFLLYGKYGNSTISASDLTRFKYRLFSIIWQHGPTWEKKLDIQKLVRAWTENEVTLSETFSSDSSHNIDTTGSTTDTTEGETSNTSKVTGKNDSTTTGTNSSTVTGSNTTDTTGSSTTESNGSSTSKLTESGTSKDTSNTTSTNSGSSTGTATGDKIKNYAQNPSTVPAITAETPLTYIDRQEYEKDTSNTTSTTEGTANSTVTSNGETSHTANTEGTTTNKETSSTTGKVTGSSSNETTGNSSTVVAGTNESNTTGSGTSSTTNTGSLTKNEKGTDKLTSTRNKSKVDSYLALWELLKDDVTEEFLRRFRELFLVIVQPELPLYYITEDSDYDE